MKMRTILFGVLFTSLLGAAALAADKEERDEQFYQKSFETLATKIAGLEKADKDKVAAKEIETIRTLVGQGQAFLANEKLKKIDPLLDRAEALVPLAKARQRRVDLDRQAEQAESEAIESETRAGEAKAAADETEQRYNDLESKGL